MNQHEKINRLRARGVTIAGAALICLVFAAQASALVVDPADQPAGVESADEPMEDPATPMPEPAIGEGGNDIAERVVPAPPDDAFFPAPVTTNPPKLDAANFGIGWPAAAAVGVALAAVLVMALTWNREKRT